MGCLEGLILLWVSSQQAKLLLFGKHSWKLGCERALLSHEEAPSFQAGENAPPVLAHPWENQRHTWLLRCALRKKRNTVLPVSRGAVTQSWPSMDSWAQWERSRPIPAPGSCSGGQAWPLLSHCLGKELLAFRRAWDTFGSTPFWVCHVFAFPSSQQGRAGSAQAPC